MSKLYNELCESYINMINMFQRDGKFLEFIENVFALKYCQN